MAILGLSGVVSNLRARYVKHSPKQFAALVFYTMISTHGHYKVNNVLYIK